MSRAPARIRMAPPHPGAFIREEILDELGLTVSEAAKVLNVRRATLSDLVNGNAALSALRVEKAFGVKMETLLNMQAWHEAHAMRQREGEIDVKRYRPPPLSRINRWEQAWAGKCGAHSAVPRSGILASCRTIAAIGFRVERSSLR